jgi:hypothetical protein
VLTLYSTENGVLGASLGRPPGDKTWDYIRVFPHVLPHIQFKPVAKNVYEFIFLKTTPFLVTSNSDDPPGSFHSSDTFTPHPTIEDAYKFVGRIDDRITLDNGEKVLPLPVEGRIREEPLVSEAVMFGIGRSVPGLLLFRALDAKEPSAEQYIDQVWPAIDAANRAAEAFSQIGRDMVVVLPPEAQVPSADKGNMMRARVYKMFENEIEQAYTQHSDKFGTKIELQLVLNQEELEQWLLRKCKDDFEMDLNDTTTQLYSAGLDSLRATQLRSLILKNIAPGNSKTVDLSLSKLFEAGTIQRLASMIVAFREGTSNTGIHEEDDTVKMQDLAKRYSHFNVKQHEAKQTSDVQTSRRSTVVSRG